MNGLPRLAGLGALAALLTLGADGASRTPPRPVEPDSLTFSYEVSGLRVIQRVNRGSDLVAVSVYLLGGTRQLTEGTAGIEALLLDASGHGPSERALARTGSVETLEPLTDWTVVGFVGLRQHLDASWRVLADRLLHPSLTPETVRLARDELLASVRRRYADPDQRIRLIANKVTFAGHPYALDPEGTEESLLALTPERLADYARSQLVTSRMLLVVVGNCERATIESLVTATLGRLPHGDYVWTLPPPVPRQKESHWLIEPRALPTNYILGFFTGPPASSDDYAAFRVATDILSGLLAHTVREEHGLSYAAYAPFLERAVAVGGLYASTPEPERVLPMMYDQIRRLQRTPIDIFALRQYVNHYILDYLAESATNASQADFLARAQLYLGDYRLTDQYMDQLRQVRPGDVYKVVERYMRNIQWAYIGDTVRMIDKW
jgi:zinc protease